MIKNRSAWAVVLACACFIAFGLVAGASPAAAKKKKTATFNQCVSTAIAIPDGPLIGTPASNPIASLAVPVRVPGFKGKPRGGVVTAFNSAGVRITHTDDGDLALFLVSPGGKAVALATYRDDSTNVDSQGRPAPSGDGYGSGVASCAGSLVEFGDAFAISIATPGNTALSAPITGSFRPEQPLSTFIGGPAAGLWTLIVQDVQGLDVGQINALSLSFTYRSKTKSRKKK
jgi:hypothetical protein